MLISKISQICTVRSTTDFNAITITFQNSQNQDFNEVSSKFRVPQCIKCGSGILKPNVVFYGENVPTPRKEAVQQAILSSDAVLVLGTTLHTRSGRDHIELAYKKGIPIGIINIGPSFGDQWAMFKINARCGEVMKILAEDFKI